MGASKSRSGQSGALVSRLMDPVCQRKDVRAAAVAQVDPPVSPGNRGRIQCVRVGLDIERVF
jgi:hypothetical protein